MTDQTSSQTTVDSNVLLSQLAMEFLRERNRAKRRRWFKFVIIVLMIFWVSYLYVSSSKEGVGDSGDAHVGLIDVKGKMMADDSANAENFSKSMSKAYSNKMLKALIVRIDSPGGSPVQADYIYNTIRYYRQKYNNIKIYAVCVDTCASAAYYIAAAADEIYANPSSIVGSIGVVYDGFGLVDTLHKLGATRRLQTAGRNKGFMDPFSPTTPLQEKHLQDMLDIIHQEFINRVKAGRGKRLLIDDDTFSGLFWTGVQAKQRGLIDGFASTGQLARDIIHIDHVVDYSHKDNPFERVARRMGVAMVNELPQAFGLKAAFR